jgi:tetratricopeptide (TPR) repeat protein
MKKDAPARDRKVVPLAEAAERRRQKVAHEHWAEAMESVPDGPDTAANFVMLGNMALIEGRFEDAIEALSRALALAPNDVGARAGRGRARSALGEYALALEDFDAAVRVEDAPGHHAGRATALAMLGRMGEAVDATSRAIAAAPDRAGAYYLRAVYRSQLDPDDPRVSADLDRCVELAPHAAPYIRVRAERLMVAEEYDLAIADLDRAISLAPEDARLHYWRGKCLTQRASPTWNAATQQRVYDDANVRRCVAALVSLEKALALAPEDGELYTDILFAMVCARECMPDEDAFLAAIDRALAKSPTDVVLLHLREDHLRPRGGAARSR